MSVEESSYLVLELGPDLNFRGLVLGGIIIGTLGVLDDICIGQASAIFELVNANRDLSWRQLFSRSLNIGRDHIAAMVNTLLLAYVGASLPLMLVFSIYQEPIWRRINREPIAEEIVRTLVGSLGLVMAVPITSLVASLLARWAVRAGRERGSRGEENPGAGRAEKQKSEGADGMLNRLLKLLETGGTHRVSDLARELEATPDLVEMMLEDLVRMGRLKHLSGECSGTCQTCPMAGMCAAGGSSGQLWALT